jgi:uncharacterized protein (TIGR02453 family)
MNSYFDEEFLAFFSGLAKHNNREWFEKNKTRYIQHVKEPFQSFIEEMIVRLHFEDERINIEAKDAIFRIYRDMRFSKDKTPYKLHASALISPHGRKDLVNPSFYIELSHKSVGIYGGAYFVERNNLKKLRRFIANNHEEFASLLKDRNFKKYFGEMKGEKTKRIDKEFVAALEKEPLIANKEFYYGADLPAELVLDPKLTDTLLKYCKAGIKMNAFIEEGLKG